MAGFGLNADDIYSGLLGDLSASTSAPTYANTLGSLDPATRAYLLGAGSSLARDYSAYGDPSAVSGTYPGNTGRPSGSAYDPYEQGQGRIQAQWQAFTDWAKGQMAPATSSGYDPQTAAALYNLYAQNRQSTATGRGYTPILQSFGDWLNSATTKQQYGLGQSAQNVYNQFLGGVTDPQQHQFLAGLYQDVYNAYQGDHAANPNGAATFAQWLSGHGTNPMELVTGWKTSDQYGRQSIHNGVIVASDQNPTAYYQTWVDAQGDLSPEQKQVLKSEYDSVYAGYTAAKAQNPYAYSSFNAYLGGVSPQATMAKGPDQFTQSEYLNWVNSQPLSPPQRDQLRSDYSNLQAQWLMGNQQGHQQTFQSFLGGQDPSKLLQGMTVVDPRATFMEWASSQPGLTADQQQALEARYLEVYGKYLGAQDQAPSTTPTFTQWLQTINPTQQIQQYTQGSPFAAQNSFARRVRWFG